MAMMKELVERRKHRRFQVKEGALAVLRVPWPRSTKLLGQIIDISMGGLAFSYSATEERPNESVELVILLADKGFYLDKVPFKTISDSEITNEARRCSVQFGQMTYNQMFQLEYFIRNHTTEEV